MKINSHPTKLKKYTINYCYIILGFIMVSLVLFFSSCKSDTDFLMYVDDGTYRVAVTDCYSDTHLTEWTVQIDRLDGEPLAEEEDLTLLYRSELVSPTVFGEDFNEAAFLPQDSWMEDSSFFQSYRIYTSPTHQEVSLRQTQIDGEEVDLLLTFTPTLAPYKEKAEGNLEFDDGTVVDTALLSERSGLIVFYSPISEEDPTIDGYALSISPCDVTYTVQGDNGEILWEGSSSANGFRGDRPGYIQYTYHTFFFDDPLPLDKAASIVLNGNEIPLSE